MDAPSARSAATRALSDAANGDREAFRRVIDLLGPAVHGTVRTVVDDLDAAATITRRALIEAWRTAPTFAAVEQDAEAWLRVLAHRAAVAAVRAGEATGRGDLAADNAALVELDPIEARALEATYHGARTCEEVARELDLPVIAIRRALRHGLRRLSVRLLGPGASAV